MEQTDKSVRHTAGTESREEQAKREVGRTEIPRSAAWFLITVFVGTVFGVPAVQHLLPLCGGDGNGGAGQLSFYAEWKGTAAAMAEAWRDASTPLRRVLDPNARLLERITAYQDAMDDTCFLTVVSRPPVQSLMCRLGVGNEKALVGRGGWLFYEPDISHVTGPGFLDPQQLHKRSRAGNEWRMPPQPDPVKAIAHFRNELQGRGIELIVVPTPVKPTIEPGHFARRAPGTVANSSYGTFVRELRDREIAVFDPTDTLAGARKEHGNQYLRTDTHWRPAAMRRVARELARRIRQTPALSSSAAPPASEQSRPARYTRRPVHVRNLGDIAVMLQLPPGQTLYPEEEVTIDEVVQANGRPWENDPKADVLLLGDSFSNIFSLQDMGWGRNAGLAEQVSCELQAPVERIVRNDAGAHAARQTLARDMARGRDRLAGKKVVIWQFACRELSFGDWRLIEMRLGERSGTATDVKTGPTGDLVTAVVTEVSNRPKKGAVYRDFVMKLYVTGLTDADGNAVGDGDGVVHVLAMENRAILPIAAVREGDSVSLTLRPWREVEGRFGTMKSGALADAMLEIEKRLYWGVPATVSDGQ